MRWLISSSARYPWQVLAVIVLVSLVAVSQLGQLRIRVSAQGMHVQDAPAVEFHRRALDTFGADNPTVVFIRDPDLFEPANLGRIRDVVGRIGDLDHVSRTASLFSTTYLRTVDGYVYTDPYLKAIPATRAEADRIRDAALQNPLVRKNLLSPDGTAMAVNVYFDGSESYPGYDEDRTAALERAIAPLKSHLAEVFQIGDAYVRSGISERIRADQRVILPLALLVLLVTLGLTVGHVNALIIPVLTAGLSILWTLGLMAALGIPVTIMTSVVPALLIIIGSTEDIHLLAEYHSGLGANLSSRKAVEYMADHMGLAVLLTMITTYLGFLSVSLNNLELLRQFGLVASTGLLLNFLITVTLLPVCLRLFRLNPGAGRARREGRPYARATLWLYGLVSRRRTLVIGVILGVMATGFLGATRLQVNNNVMDYFDPDSEVIARAQAVQRELSGVQTLSVVVTGTEGTFLQVPYLESLYLLQDALVETGRFDKTFSFADFIAVVHAGLDDESAGEVYLPERNEVVREYMSFVDHAKVRDLVSADFSQARVLVRHDIRASRDLNAAVAEIARIAAQKLDPALEVQVTGEAYLNSQAVQYMAQGQKRSLVLMLAVIFVLVSLLFLKARAGLVAVLANLFPIVLLFGFMGYLGYPLDTGSVMVAAIALGICVDHTMHFLVRYHHKTQRGTSEAVALRQTVAREAVPIVATSIALAAGFGTLMFSSFPPVARFGLLSALVMLLALAGTFIMVPLLLGYTRLITLWDLLSVHIKQGVIQRCDLFRGLSNSQIRRLVALSDVRKFRQDEAMVRQGETSDEMFVMLEGNAEVWRTRPDGSTYQLHTLLPGEVFGEIAVVATNHERIADVVATEPSRVMVLRWSDIHRIARIYPRVSSRLFHNLSAIIGKRLTDVEPGGMQMEDELSGAYSFSYFLGLLDFATHGANRYDERLSVLVVSPHGFDQVRSRFGAITGNWVIREFAQVVRGCLRRSDILARLGDERFAILMPNLEEEEGQGVLTRLHKAVAAGDFGVVGGAPLLQVGMVFLTDGEDGSSFLCRAEAAHRNAAPSEPVPGILALDEGGG